ncbi:MAG: ABC transporter permease [Verrucomicrobiales bacterium]
MPRSRWFLLLLVPALAWLVVFFLVPLGMTGAAAFATRGDPIEWQASTQAWSELAKDGLATEQRDDGEGGNRWRFKNEALSVGWRTFWVSLATTLASLLLGFPVALFIVRRSERWRRLLYGLVMLPLVANSLILAYAWVTLLRRDGLIEKALRTLGALSEDGSLGIIYTPAALVIGMVYWYLPFMIYPIYGSLEKLDWRLLEAAADLGAGAWQRFIHILLPLIRPGIITGCLLVFVQAVGTLVFPELLGGSKTRLLGPLIHDKFLSYPENFPLGSALALVVMLLTFIGVWFVLRFGDDRDEAEGAKRAGT